MQTIRRLSISLTLIAGLASAQGAAKRRPYIGYLCAAGGKKGTTVRIVAGGQNLRGAYNVVVSGEGVTGKVVKHTRTPWLLRNEDRQVVARTIRRLAAQKIAAQTNPRRDKNRNAQGKNNRNKNRNKNKKKKGANAKKAEPPRPLPDHPMLKNLEAMTVKELRRVAYEFLDPARRSQLSAQIAEAVVIEIKIDARAEPGDREFRLATNAGLTNPVLFQVGTIPEFGEGEPNDYRTIRQTTAEAPFVINGQVSFKDLDRFRFRAEKGQKLVIETQARRLVPYLADAVPGWFQATLTLYDAQGKEVLFSDDHRFDPDPVIFFDVPQSGEYVLEIRDAIYRGRQDFVYRVTVAERPFVLTMFPLGGKAGTVTTAKVEGWNLAWKHLRLNTRRGNDPIRQATWSRSKLLTNPVLFAVGELPERNEAEPNDARLEAQRIDLSRIVNGRIVQAGGADWYRFNGRAGQEIVVEVHARRLGSPLDSLLQLTDAAGHVVAWNDDHPDRCAGLVTHQADSYLRAKLMASETHYIRVTDAQGHGGAEYAYRLRLSPPRPDFTVIVTPASINVPAGGLATMTVHAVRRDGFEGAIDLSLPDAKWGMFLGGARIPAGCDRIRMTLAAPPTRGRRLPPIPLRIDARAKVGRKLVHRPAVPAEDMMQAFGLRHLVPAQQLLVDITRSWRRTPAPRLKNDRPTPIPAGGMAEVRIPVPGLPALDKVLFKLDAPPKGITLGKPRAEQGQLVLTLIAERGKVQAGLKDNIIIEAHVEVPPPKPRVDRNKKKGKAKKGDKKPKAKAKARPKRYVAVLLPAVPIEVVEAEARTSRN